MLITATDQSHSITSLPTSNTMDNLMYIQMLLLDDANDQVKGLSQKMRANLELKENYRTEINNLERILNTVLANGSGPDGNKKIKSGNGEENGDTPDDPTLNPIKILNNCPEAAFLATPSYTDGSIKDYAYRTDLNGGLGGVESSSGGIKILDYTERTSNEGPNGTPIYWREYFVEQKSVENGIKYLENKLDGLNSDSDRLGLSLQDLTGKRKMILEILTGLIGKQGDLTSQITRNIGK